ncbi:DUF1609 domain-containing protein [Encephalitozoon intestinalis]
MVWKKILVFKFFDIIACSMVESSVAGSMITSVVKLKGTESESMPFPLLFRGTGMLIVQPTTKFSDLRRDLQAMIDVREFIESGNLAMGVWMFAAKDLLYTDDDRFKRMFSEKIVPYLQKISLDLWKIYEKRNKTFSELLMMAYKRVFQCEEVENREMTKFGEAIISEVEKMVEEAEEEEDEEKKRKKIVVCYGIKKYGERLCNRSWWKKIINAERIVCEACSKLYETLEEVELMGCMVEGWVKKVLKENSISEEEACEYLYLEYRIISVGLLLTTCKERSKDVVEEIIKQIMIGKDGEEIDLEYVEKVSDAVRRRQKAEEERRLKIERELLGESEDSGGRKKKKSRGGGRKKRLAAEEKKEEEGEKEEEEELVGAVGGVSISSDSGKSKGKQSERPNYKLHKRITRWSKDADKIKKELDNGKEEKWKGRNIKEIREQKEVHDIVEVVELLRSPDESRFFIDLGGDENRIQKMATATLERGGRREVGIVEVGIFKNGKGEHVIYHLMFRVTKVEEVRSAMSSLAAEKEYLSEEQMSEGEFVYPPGVRCSTLKEEGKFKIEYRNPKNTDEILRKLTILARPEIL